MSKGKRWVAVAVMGYVGASGSGEARAADRPAITIVVYNYAGIAPKSLGETKRSARRVLRAAGIETRWCNAPLAARGKRQFCREGDSHPIVRPRGINTLHRAAGDCPRPDRRPQDPFGPATLVLRLLPREMTERLGFRPNHYGFALLGQGEGFPVAAAVLCDRAERLAKGAPSLVPVILGHLMAHEIGHLLLPPGAHSDAGIMSAPWSEDQLKMARRGRLLFTVGEAEKIRAEVLARLAASGASAAPAMHPSAQ